MIFFKSTAQKGREYSHWIDLTLNSHFEAVISKIYLAKVRFLSKSTLWGSTKRSEKVQKGPAAQKPIFVGQNKKGGGRADLKNAGVQKFSSFIWTLVVKTENGGSILKGWVNSEGGG